MDKLKVTKSIEEQLVKAKRFIGDSYKELTSFQQEWVRNGGNCYEWIKNKEMVV